VRTPIALPTRLAVIVLTASATGLTNPASAGLCGTGPPPSPDFVAERSAGDVLAVMRQVDTQHRQGKFDQSYKSRQIPVGGWMGAVEGRPLSNKGLCRFSVIEERSGARVQVYACQENCNFIKGDRVKLSGWLSGYDAGTIDIVTDRIIEPLAAARKGPAR
jgi:hypothetical protein